MTNMSDFNLDFNVIIKNSCHISQEEYANLFIKFDDMGLKCKKLEFLQSYEFVDDITDFKDNNYDNFINMLKEFSANAWGGKDNIKRLHYIQKPLDIYLQMEYYTYLITANFGQDIRINSKLKMFLPNIRDFIIFENNNLFILDFNNNTCNGAWHITNKNVISQVESWFDYVFGKSKNFKSMLKPNKTIIKMMKKNKLI